MAGVLKVSSKNKKRGSGVLRPKSRARSKKIIEATHLGVSPAHTLGAGAGAIFPAGADFGDKMSSASFRPAGLQWRHNLISDIPGGSPYGGSAASVFHKPLLGGRASFWIGVGVGVFIVGVLSLLIWQFIKVDLVRAVVVGLMP